MSKNPKPNAPQGYAVHRYHSTPLYNLQSILKRGIDPAFSKGAKETSWYVHEELIEWSIDHIMKKYELSQVEIVVLEVLQAPGLFVSAPTPMVFQTYNLIRPIAMFSAEMWIARTE